MSRVPGMTARRRRAVFVVPDPDTPGLTEAESLALRLRRDATISGSCVCGSVRPRIRLSKRFTDFTMQHAEDCPAADGPTFDAIVERDQLRWQTVVADVEVAA